MRCQGGSSACQSPSEVFRRELSRNIVEQALTHVEDDLAAGIWELPANDLVDVFSRAEALSRRHAATVGARSLDILHVVAALMILAASAFVTADVRQARLARAAGLRVSTLR
ncbi:MAG TPA: hypothetical protein VF524_15805 [Polyangia bacterium]